ncbi:MAG: group II intron reverse transcriptase/maturase [Maledivibacter sp.]|jgi:group II intron reverse transcriptase/maturase|nr:group II intron reverse transcriptase/maturase [Maledivibacter sp.]
MTTKGKKKAKLRYVEYYDLQDVLDKLYSKSLDGKIFKKLMPLITSEENIRLAFRTLKKNKGSKTAGTDNRTIKNLAKLSDERLIYLVKRKLSWYEPQPVKRVKIPKPNDPTKLRPLGIPTIMDRLIQQCVLQILEPICEAKFHDSSYGFRPNRSTKHAIAETYRLMQLSQCSFVVDIDIKGFFDNVNHGKLLKQMWHMGIRDKTLISIISTMLKAEIAGIGFPEKGTPQGGIISPLLSNIVLNELDWWIDSQWVSMPTKKQYATGMNPQGTPINSSRYGSLRRLTNLKECYIVRYADDFKIFCKSKVDADKLYFAVKDWLKNRLGLEINEQKSQVVNLKKRYSEFLGLKLKLRRQGKKSNGKPKYIVKSHITEKSAEKIVQKAHELIYKIQYPKDRNGQFTATYMYNSFVIGVHNYYNMATRVQEDFRKIAFPIHKSLKARLRERLKKRKQLDKRKIKYTIPKHIQECYGKSKQLRFIGSDKVLVPIGYVSHKKPMAKAKVINKYTPKGREQIHKRLEQVNMDILHYLMRNPIKNSSIEFNDNRLSLYCAQRGKCAVSKITLEKGDIYCHHKKPRYQGGKDNYRNLTIVSEVIHKLIHANREETIFRLLSALSLDKSQIMKLNKLRKLVNVDNCFVIPVEIHDGTPCEGKLSCTV